MLHQCAAPGCPLTINSRLLMCPVHWREVPDHLKARVREAWRRYDGAKHRWDGPAHWRVYCAARREAIASLA